MVVGKGLFLDSQEVHLNSQGKRQQRTNYPINLEDLWLAKYRYLGHPSIDL